MRFLSGEKLRPVDVSVKDIVHPVRRKIVPKSGKRR
jgi:hypothetical protein